MFSFKSRSAQSLFPSSHTVGSESFPQVRVKRHSFCEQAICRHPGSSWSFEQLVSALSRDLPCAAGPFLDVSSPSSCRKLTSSAPSQPSPPTWLRWRSRFTAASTQCWVSVRLLPAHCGLRLRVWSRPRTLHTTRQLMRPPLWLTSRLPAPVPHKCLDDHAHSLSEAAAEEGSSMCVQCASFGSSTGSRVHLWLGWERCPAHPIFFDATTALRYVTSSATSSASPVAAVHKPYSSSPNVVSSAPLDTHVEQPRRMSSRLQRQQAPQPPRRLSIPLPRAPVANVSEVSDAETLQQVHAA